uniref:Receptor Binding Protein sandwich domain, phage receptor.75A n=1 Tax=Myoviridae sp. ctCL221 TaxID=2826630 RepID=A0A8S5M6A5_9CAUD|nr:MAG TPA: Receptor Binding Protein sandwich domain, phage receptor.75A [Myoviridae sp. ctCL221]
MIKGFRFTNQLANAEVDARIHQEFLNKNDGIFYGMNISKTNNSITISEGLCEIAGRPVAVIDSETVNVGTENLYCLLILEIDLSKDSTKDVFNQASFKLLTSSTSYPTVTQQDINKYSGTESLYQLEFARFRSGLNGISEFKDTRKFLSFSGIYAQIKADCDAIINQIKQELKNVEDGSAYLLKKGDGKIEGSLEVTNNFKCNNITNSNRK